MQRRCGAQQHTRPVTVKIVRARTQHGQTANGLADPPLSRHGRLGVPGARP